MKTEFHIERVILEGVELEPGRIDEVREAISVELSDLFRDGAIATELAGGGARPRLRGGRIDHESGASPRGLGRAIARAVYDGVGARADSRTGGGQD